MLTSESFLYRQKEGNKRPQTKSDAERVGKVAEWYGNDALLNELTKNGKSICFYEYNDYPYHTYYAIKAKDILPLLENDSEWAQCHLKIYESEILLCQPEEWLVIAWRDES
jgi:hypothetical protein